jgi:hypothetical protein
MEAKKQKPNPENTIKVTRNISAKEVIECETPVKFPKSEILYSFNVKDWPEKSAFYDSIECSFGTPSTQKPVFNSYLNKKVMHYERTCQGGKR